MIYCLDPNLTTRDCKLNLEGTKEDCAKLPEASARCKGSFRGARQVVVDDLRWGRRYVIIARSVNMGLWRFEREAFRWLKQQ